MSTTTMPRTPQGNLPALGIPDVQDYPRLVFTAPYFEQVALAEVLDPAVQEAVEGMLPTLLPPFVQDAANQAVQQNAVLLAGSTMTGPLMLSPEMPTAPSMAASMAYVEAMIATAGVPEVPVVPAGQTWARQTGQWVPITETSGVFLPVTGGTMQGAINMSGNSITNLAAIPTMPYGAAPAQWVLNQIASLSLYQGTWNVDTYVPDLTAPSTHINGFMWIAVTTVAAGVVISPPIPGLQGLTVHNGDTVIFSAAQGVFQLISSQGLTLPQAEALFLPLAGGQMSGALLLNANPTQPMQAANMSWVQSLLAGAGLGEAPSDGQLYGRNGNAHVWLPTVPLAGGIMTGALLLSANATQQLGAVPLQQLNTSLAGYVPVVGNVTVTGPLSFQGLSANITLNSNAAAALQPVPLQQMQSTLASYLTIAVGLPLVSLNPPVAPVAGQFWLNTADMQTYIWTGAQWIVAVNPPIPDLSGYALLSGATFTGAVAAPSLHVTGTSTLTGGGSTGPLSVAPGGISYTGVTGGAMSNNQAGTVLPIGFTFYPGSVTPPASQNVGTIGFSQNGVEQGYLVRSTWSPGNYANVVQFIVNSAVTAASVSLNGTSNASWSVTSCDAGLKHNLAEPIDALAEVCAVPMYSCDYVPEREDAKDKVERWDCTFLAQDVRKRLPYAVLEPGVDTGYATLHPLHMVAVLWRAVQQLSERLQAVEGHA